MKHDREKQLKVIERLRSRFQEEGLYGESAERVLDKMAEPVIDGMDDFMLGEFLLLHLLKVQVACPSGESFDLVAGIARDTTLTLLTTSPDPSSTIQGIVAALVVNMLHNMQTEQERKAGEAIAASRQDGEDGECDCPVCQMIDEIMGVKGDDLTDEERDDRETLLQALSGGIVPAR